MGGGGKRLRDSEQDSEKSLLVKKNNTDGKCLSLDVVENNTLNEDGGDDGSNLSANFSVSVNSSDGEQIETESPSTNFPNIHDNFNTTSKANSVSNRTYWVSVFLFLCALGGLAGVVVVLNNNLSRANNTIHETENIKNSLDTISKTIATLNQKIEDLDSGNRGTFCTKENQTCKCTGTVSYGAYDKWVTKKVNGVISCSNSVFGDPIKGVGKSCYCSM